MNFLREHRSYLLPSFLRAALMAGLLAPGLIVGSNPHHLFGTMTAIPVVAFVAFILGMIFASSWRWKPHLWGLWLALPLLGFFIVEVIVLRGPWFEPGWFLLVIYLPAVLAGAFGAVAGSRLVPGSPVALLAFRLAAIFTLMLGAISLGLSFQMQPPPVAVADAFAKSVERDNVETAYVASHPSLQERESLETFTEAVAGTLPVRGDDGIEWAVHRNDNIATVESIPSLTYEADVRFWLKLDGYVWKITGYRIVNQSGDVIESGAGQ